MIIRLSQKLKTKIKVGKLSEMPLHENPYADWSCHLFTADRFHYIILTNTASLYSCVMPGRGISEESGFLTRALETLRDYTADDALQFLFRKFISPAAEDVTFAKPLNRSVIGSMNEFVEESKWCLSDGLPYTEIGYRLGQTPMSALTGPDGQKYGRPREAFINLSDRMPNH